MSRASRALIYETKGAKPLCEGCGIAERGQQCGETLTEYRGHNLCYWCIWHWKQLEEKHGRTIEFEEYRKGGNRE